MKTVDKQMPSNTSLISKRWIIQLFTLVILLGLLFFLLFVIWKIPQLQVGNAPLTFGEKARLDAETSARRDHWQVMEVLTAFVREKAKLDMEQKPFIIIDHLEESQREYNDYYIDDYGDELDGTTCTPNQDYIYPTPVDIQAALTALGRRATINENNEQYRLDLSRTDLRGARLTGNFSRTNLEGANLKWAELRNVDFRGASLTKVDLELAKFTEVKLQGANLESSQLRWAKFTSTKLYKASLKSSCLSKTEFQNSNLEHADLTGADFSNTVLDESTKATLKKSNLERVNFSGANLSNVDLEGISLVSANFDRAVLTNAKLARAILNSASFRSANLTDVDLRGSNLEYSKFDMTTLHRAKLQNANLCYAVFDGAKLKGASFEAADLQGATLMRVDLEDVDLSALNLTPGQVKFAINLQAAIFSREFQQQLGLTDKSLE